MSVADLSCDRCGTYLTGSVILEPGRARSAVRLMLHPGDPLYKDDSILVCLGCWKELGDWMGEANRTDACCVCGVAVAYDESLHVLEMTGRLGEAPLWQLCRDHGVELMNGFRFVEPKLEPGQLSLKADFAK